MSQPTQDPTWDSNATHTTPTLAGHKTDGFAEDEVPDSDELNYWMMAVGAWINFLKTLVSHTLLIPANVAGGDVLNVAHNASPIDQDYKIQLPVGVRITAVRARTSGADTLWTATTTYAAGQRVGNDTSPAKIYQCTSSGTSAGSGGPTGTGTGIVDGSCTWDFVGNFGVPGTGPLTLKLRSDTDGAVATIATSVASVNNGSAEYLSLTGLTTDVAAGVFLFATVHDIGVGGGTVFGIEVDHFFP